MICESTTWAYVVMYEYRVMWNSRKEVVTVFLVGGFISLDLGGTAFE